MRGLYRGYGLTFASDLTLPGFARAEPPADVTITLGTAARETAEAMETPVNTMVPHPEGGHLLRVADAGDFWIRDEGTVLVTPADQAEEAYVRLYLTGSVMGLILHLRGIQTLHAATVAIAGTAIAFVGEQGAGKSTLAATMAAAHPVLGDDVIALQTQGDQVLAHPGGAEFKLWQDTLDHLDWPRGSQIANRTEKFFVPRGEVSTADPVRLGAVVVLERGGPQIAAARYTPLEATDLIVQHGYRPEFVPSLGRQADHFRQAAQLTARIPVWRLTRPEGLAQLAKTRSWLEDHWADLIARDD
ncbi:MAG: hypothetical protein AAGC79_07275 [Pseudomonadota bacterium]